MALTFDGPANYTNKNEVVALLHFKSSTLNLLYILQLYYFEDGPTLTGLKRCIYNYCFTTTELSRVKGDTTKT